MGRRSRSRSRSRSRGRSRSRRRSRSRSSPRRSPVRRRGGSSRSRSRPSPRRRGGRRSRQRSRSRRRQRCSSGSPRSPSSDGEFHSRIWVAHTDCARIIGRRGEARKDIEQQSDAQLRIQREEDMDPGRKERYIELSGTSRQRQAAIRMIMKVASYVRDDRGQVLKDGQTSKEGGGNGDVLHIQPGEVGRVLGRGGENIRRIEEDSGARLELHRDDGRLEIKGSPDAVARAREMVLAEVSHARDGSGSLLKDDLRGPSGPAGTRGGGSGSAGGGGPSGGNAPLRLWVFSKEAGRVIGRGGETVREIMQRTGTEVQVQRSDGTEGGTTEREIKVFGSKAQQEEVLRMICWDVSYVRGEMGVIKSPEMGPREVEDMLRRNGTGQGGPMPGGPGGLPPPPWMGGPPGPMGMMGPPGMMGMMPGMMPPGMPGAPGGPPAGMPPPPGMPAPGGLPPPPLGPPPPGMGGPAAPGMGGGPSPEGRKMRSKSRSSSSSSSSSGKKKRAGRHHATAGQEAMFFPAPWIADKPIDMDEL